MLKLIFDISVLGIGHFNVRGRTGVFRVTENLAYQLSNREDCELYFSSIYSLRVLALTMAYLQYNKKFFHKTPLITTGSTTFDTISKKLHTIYFKSTLKHGSHIIQFASSSAFKIINFFFPPIKNKKLAHCNVFHSPFFPLPPKKRKRKFPTRFLTIHDLIPIIFPHFFPLRETMVLKKTLDSLNGDDWIFTVSQSSKNDLCSYFSIEPERVFVTYPAASDNFSPCHNQEYIEMVRAKYNIPEGPYFLSLGTLEPRKNMAHTIECFASLIEQEHLYDVNLVLVGPKGWQYDNIFKTIDLHPAIQNRIILTGYVDDEELSALYTPAIAFLYPSLYEGFGLPPLEAMQCGAPVIVSNTSSLPEVVGKAGLFVSPKDKDALCQSMLNLYNKPGLRESLKSRSLEQAGKFSWFRCVNETIAAYKQAIY